MFGKNNQALNATMSQFTACEVQQYKHGRRVIKSSEYANTNDAAPAANTAARNIHSPIVPRTNHTATAANG